MRTCKAILAGAGPMGRAWLRNLIDSGRVEVVAVVDLDLLRAETAVAEASITASIYNDLSAALAFSEADFLVDATVPEAHCEVTIRALQAGLHVLGEKPMASSLPEAQQMVRASEESGKLYMVSQSRRYNRNLRALKDLIQEIGKPEILNADFFIGAHFGGFRDEMESPLVLDMAIHTFDAARYLTDADHVSVYCEEFNPSWSWYSGKASATCIFEMSDGLRFTYRGSWCSEGMHTSWDSSWRAAGPRGTAMWDGETAPIAEIVRGSGDFHSELERIQGLVGDQPEGIAGSLEDFLHALDTGSTPMGECHDNIKSLAMVFAAKRSSELGRKVEISEL